jgi:hypothetical protein
VKTTRCTDCASEFSDEELANASTCPTCGTKSVPCAIKDDVSLKINWHELRILTIWASNYAESPGMEDHSRRTLRSILRRLQDQHPGKTALTLAGEVQGLVNALGGEAKLLKGDGSVETFKGVKPS